MQLVGGLAAAHDTALNSANGHGDGDRPGGFRYVLQAFSDGDAVILGTLHGLVRSIQSVY